jgi:hypothetical protein
MHTENRYKRHPMSANWFVLSGEQQLGPYTGEQLVQFAQEGRVAAETMVWAEGMAEWVTASQVPGLLPEAPAAVVAPVAAKPALATSNWAPPGARTTSAIAPATTAAYSPYTTPGSSLLAAVPSGSYPFFSIKPASFNLWMWTFIGSFLGIVIGFVMFFGALTTNAAPGQADTTNAKLILFAIFVGAGVICSLLSQLFFLMNLYRAWSCLRAGAPRTTPGSAVGLLFVPFYNFYWVFVAIAGLPKDWNRIVSQYEDLRNAPRMSENVFLLYAIGVFVAPLALIMIFPMMSQLCAGINFFAYRRNTTSPGAAGAAGFGGIKFG